MSKFDFESSLDKIARMLSRRHGVNVIFEGNQAKTNGKDIILPYFEKITDEFKQDLNGYLDHEVAHVKFTDMSIKAKEYCKTQFIMEMVNGLEDIRIEKKMMELHPGVAYNIGPLREKHNANHAKILSKMTLTDKLVFASQLYVQGVPFEDDSEDFTSLFNTIKPILKRFPKALTTKGIFELAKEIETALKIEADELKKPEGKGKGSDKSDKGEKSDSKEKSDKKEKTKEKPEDKEEKEDSDEEGDDSDSSDEDSEDKSKGAGDSEDSEDEESDDSGESDKGEEEDEEGDGSSSGDESEGEESDSSSSKPISKKAKEDIKKELSKPSEKDAKIELGSTFNEIIRHEIDVNKASTREKVKETDYGKISIDPNDASIPLTTRFDVVKDYSGKGSYEEYMKCRHKVEYTILPIKQKLERLLKAKENAKWKVEQERGSLNPRSFAKMQTDKNYRSVFKTFSKTETTNVAVQILIDMSGSMGSNDKIILAKLTATALAEALKDLDITFEVTGFYTDYSREMQSLADKLPSFGRFNRVYDKLVLSIFKNFDSNSLTGISKIHVGGNNTDGECVKWAAMRLSERKEPRKIMLVLSDGQPADGSVNSTTLYNDLKLKIAQIKKSGIEIVGFGIMTDAVKKFYPEYVIIDDVRSLPTTCMQKLSSIILKD